jgi:hypothetical protein
MTWYATLISPLLAYLVSGQTPHCTTAGDPATRDVVIASQGSGIDRYYRLGIPLQKPP